MMRAATLERLKTKCVLIAVFCILSSALGTAQVWNRAARFGGGASDAGIAMKVSATGDKFLTGNFSESMKIGDRTLTSAGDTDIFLAQFGHWVIVIGGKEHDEATDVALDGAGNVFVTGWFTDHATFHSTDGTTKSASGIGETIFLAKYTGAGALLWVQTGATNSVSINRGQGVAIDGSTGAAYLTGISQGSTVFSSADGNSEEVPGPGAWHMYLVKYNGDGNFQWGGWNEADANSIPHKVAVDADGSAYVTGWFEGGATFHGVDGNVRTVTGLSQPIQTAPDYPDDSFVVKYDRDGNVQWLNDIGGYKAIMNDIAVSDSGQVSVTGLIGNINGNSQQQETLISSQLPGTTISVGGGTFTSPYNRDILVATYDQSGVALSAVRIGGTGNEEAGSIVSWGTDWYVSGIVESTGNLFIGKTTGGLLDWVKIDGGPVSGGIETLPDLALTPDGKLLAIGTFVNETAFGKYQVTSQGAEDGFLVSLRLQ